MDIPSPEEPTGGNISKFLTRLLRAYRKPTVFISYRRADTLVYAEKIHKRLEAELGKSNVFFDRKDIDLGDDFAKIIKRRVASCQVLLVLVGPDWLNPLDENGVRRYRLEDSNDYVRLEIEEGLKRENTCRVIPVLVHGARMPKADELPSTMAGFSGRNFHKIDEALLEETLENLVQSILRIELNLPELQRVESFRRGVMLLILSAVLAALAAGWVNLFDAIGVGMDARFMNVTMRLADSIMTSPPSDKVILIGVNDDTEDQFGKPFDKTWRREHAFLIRALADRGASAVVFDFFLDEPSDYDSELASAVIEARRKGTAVIFGTSRWPPEIKIFEDAGMGFGLLCIGGRKLFGYATFAALAVMRQSQEAANYLPSIALMAFASGAPIKKIDFRDHSILMLDPLGEIQTVQFSAYQQARNSFLGKTCPAISSDDTVAQSMIRLSSLEMLREPAKRRKYEDFFGAKEAHPGEIYAKKIVLVGKEDPQDQYPVFFGLHREMRYGFEFHADVLHSLIDGAVIRPLGFSWQLLVALFMAYQGQRVILLRVFRRRFVRSIFFVGVSVAYLVISAWLYANFGVLLDVYPLFAFFAAYCLMLWRARRFGIGIWNM